MIPQELISREEVIKIVNDSMGLHTTPMGELINNYFKKRINKLQTHEDRVKELIEKKIEHNKKLYKQYDDIVGQQAEIRINTLKELLNELYPNNL